MISVLLFGTGTQALAVLRPLKKMDCRIVVVTDMHSNYADDSRFVSAVYRTSDFSDEAMLEFCTDIIRKEQVDVVLPMGDFDALFVSKHKQQFPQCVIPAYDDFMKGYDKNQLMELCKEKGYPHPLTLNLSQLSVDCEEVKSFPFPAMLKPNCTTGGRGMVKVNAYNELLSFYPDLHAKYGAYHLQQFIRPGGRQVKVQLYVDKEKQLVASSVQHKVRWYPVEAGSNCCALSIEDAKIVGTCHQLLKDINWIGFADFDTIENPDTGELLIMEINPRLPASIKGSIVAGVNWPEVMVNDCLGLPQKVYDYKTGVCLRHLGLDMLWFAKSPGRWHTSPCWLSFIGKHICYQDMNGWGDMKPFFTGTWNNIRKLFDPQFRAAKQNV